MVFSAFAGICILLALIALYLGARLLGNLGWFVGFIRGVTGLTLVCGAVVFVLAGLDMMSYKQLFAEKPIMTISFKRENEQEFTSTLSYIEQGSEITYDIHGDQWQVDARVIRWSGIFQMFGATPGYRLDRLSGRYYSLEDERRKSRTVHQLDESEYGLDLWQWVQVNNAFLPIFDAVYGSAAYLPMEDGALYQVSLSANGLVASPLNAIAEDAVNRWM